MVGTRRRARGAKGAGAARIQIRIFLLVGNHAFDNDAVRGRPRALVLIDKTQTDDARFDLHKSG